MKRKITLCLTLLMFLTGLEVIQAQSMLFGYSTLFGFNTRASAMINNHSGSFVFRTTPQETIYGYSNLFVFNTVVNNTEIIAYSDLFNFNTLPKQNIFGYSATFTFNTTTDQNEIIGYSDVFLFNTFPKESLVGYSDLFTFNTIIQQSEIIGFSSEFTFNTLPKESLVGYSDLFTFNTIIQQSEIIGFSSEFTFNTLPKEIIIALSETFTFDTRSDEFHVYADVNPANSGIIEGAGEYPEGALVTLTAFANPLYEFDNWTNDQGVIVSNNAVYEFIMPSFDVFLTANFTALSFNVSVMIFPDDAGTVDGAGAYSPGELVTLEAYPNEGFYFHNWTDLDGNQISADISYSFNMPSEDFQLIANFNYILYTVWLSSSPESGGIVGGGGNYHMGELVVIEATANTGYEFESWTDSNNNVLSVDETYSFIMPAEDVQLIANFNLIDYLVSVMIEPENTGSVSGTGIYNFNDDVTLIATPNSWYEFINWTDLDGNLISEDAIYNFIMPDQNVSLIAHFDLIEGLDILRQRNLVIYPNPGRSVFYIESDIFINKIRIIDNVGRMITTKAVDAPKTVLEISHIPEGVYLIQVFFEDYIVTRKVSVVN